MFDNLGFAFFKLSMLSIHNILSFFFCRYISVDLDDIRKDVECPICLGMCALFLKK